MDLFKHIYFEEDGVGVDQFIPEEKPTEEPAAEASEQKEEKVELPAWTSQLPKDTRENAEVMKRIAGHKNIVDLVNAYIASDDAGKNALHIPGKDSKPEEVRAFFTKLGVPEKPGDYNLPDYDLEPESIAKSKELFMAAAHRSALTKRQAENMWMSEVAMFKAAGQISADKQQKIKDAFEPQYSRLLEAEYPEETARKKVMKEELAAVTKFAQEQGIGKALAESGIVYNPEVMHKLAAYIRSNSPEFIQGKKAPETQKASGGMFDNYSSAFLEAVGR